MALNAVMFPFARHQFGWDYRPFSLFLSYQSLLRLVGVGIVLPILLRSGWVARVGGSRGVIAAALSCRACELLCFVLATRGWQLFAIGGEFTIFCAGSSSCSYRDTHRCCHFQGTIVGDLQHWRSHDCCATAPCPTGLTLLTALAEPLLRAAMVACILPVDNGALQGVLSAGKRMQRASLASQKHQIRARNLQQRNGSDTHVFLVFGCAAGC